MERLIFLIFCGLFAAQPLCAHAGARSLPVPRATIYPGDVITSDLLAEQSFEVRTSARLGVFEQATGLVGKVARRTLMPGQPVALGSVRPPDLVRQGRPAAAVYQADGLVITMQVTPLQSGIAGDFIAVQNSDSGVVIKGTIQDDGTIKVGTP
jgi:flagella basal body P-ring formation protein FlgA